MRELRNVLLLLALVGTALASVPAPRAESAVAAAPRHSISVTGPGVVTYPDFDESVDRYAITTTAATGGTVTIEVATTGTVTVNGRPAPGGTRTVSGLEPGDEIAVFVADGTGTAWHSYVYLPPGFPELERTTPAPAPGALQSGLVMLTLSQWVRPTTPEAGGDLQFFETAVDANGVPAFVTETKRSADLKRQPSGQYTVFRGPAQPSDAGEDLVLLDAQLRPVSTRRTVNLVNTDFHDSILLPDGTLWLMAYEPNPSTGLLDSVIQRIDPDGTVGWEWSSEPYVGDAVLPQRDYAHINSFDVMSDGHLLVSFRHFSAVFKIATHDDPGGAYSSGDVIWKLGGRDSDFEFPSGEDGPCAQHTAEELPNGRILLFDNGSWNDTQSWCVDQDAPSGAPIQRVQTRVVEFELNEADHTATPHEVYAPPGWFAIFAGSTQALANDNVLIGWAEETLALASEIDHEGNLLWEIRDPSPNYPYFTYRAHKAEVPDAMAPTVRISVPDGASFVEGSPVPFPYECSDRGGSSLQTCTGTRVAGNGLDTSTPGEHRLTVEATDGAGNRTTATRSYRVLASTQPDAMIKKADSKFQGDNRYGPARSQQVSTRVEPGSSNIAWVRLQNDGARATRMKFDVRGAAPGYQVLGRYADGGTTRVLQPGQSWTFRLRVMATASAQPGDRLVLRIPTRSSAAPVRRDAVSVVVGVPR